MLERRDNGDFVELLELITVRHSQGNACSILLPLCFQPNANKMALAKTAGTY